MLRLKNLTSEEQKWLVIAVSHIALSDGQMEEDEKAFVKKMLNVFMDDTNREFLDEVNQLVHQKELPSLPKIETSNLDHTVYMLDVLSAAVFINGKKLHAEVEKFFEAGRKLGVHVGTLSFRLSLEAEKFRVNRKLKQIREDIKVDLMRTMPTH